MKKILIVGNGAREHSLGWKLSQSEKVSEVLYVNGNAGTSEEKGRNVFISDLKKKNFPVLSDLIKSENVDLTIVGPEKPLADGLVDFLNSRGDSRVFGPSQNASRLEGDKFYSYDLMKKLEIPQADSIKCYSTEEAIESVKKRVTCNGIVIKARGLTGGKGISVCDSEKLALEEITQHSKKYGQEVLIAERLFGQEFSVFGISDGKKISPLEISVQDHKRLLDGDCGVNTGGMGAYCPVLIASRKVVREVAENIMTPVIQEMKERGNEYKGFLYAGMILTEQGLKVIEFNVRFGDPECQPLMMMIKGDLYEYLSLATDGKLNETKVEFNSGAACCVVLASKGYPEYYKIDLPISGLNDVARMDNVKVFHAGTKLDKNKTLTNGGRVLGVTAYSLEGLADAQKLAYKAVSKINISGGFHYRTDIADKSLKCS